MNAWKNGLFAVFCAAIVLVQGCAQAPENKVVERYVSPEVQGESQKINLDEVQKAFWDTKANDFKSWMAAFEKRVNEIYEGNEIVAVDATREKDRLKVTGYVENKKEPGFQEGEEKLFTVEQTGDVVNNEVPYRVATGQGHTYYEGHRSILDNPIVQMLFLSHMMGAWGGRYYTPYSSYDTLRNSRTNYRNTPDFSKQQTANRDFTSRFKNKLAGGGLESRTKFGSSPFSSETGTGTRNRSWSGSSSTSESPRSIWGGRRQGSGSPFGGLGRRGWGGRRR